MYSMTYKLNKQKKLWDGIVEILIKFEKGFFSSIFPFIKDVYFL